MRIKEAGVCWRKKVLLRYILLIFSFFYNPKCVFSEELAPAINALPFNYPSMVAVAVDATQFSRFLLIYSLF